MFDEALPVEVRELPGDLARLDVLLSDPVLLEPIAERWEASAVAFGRPTIPMSLFVRLMVIKQRSGWGYETLAREVSDSLHLRQFCGLSLKQVLKLTGEGGQLVARSIREARRLIARARASARGRGAQRKLAAAARLQRTVDVAETVTRQITKRLTGERVTDRVVSLADPDARPIGKGKLGKRYEFGYVFQLAEVTPNTGRGARGLLLPAASRIGSPNESELLPETANELSRLGIKPREVALDGGFPPDASNQAFPGSHVFIAGRQQPAARRHRKRLASYRVGCEARISHLKRSYGLRRSRLRRHQGARSWAGWAILAYNLDTLAVQAA